MDTFSVFNSTFMSIPRPNKKRKYEDDDIYSFFQKEESIYSSYFKDDKSIHCLHNCMRYYPNLGSRVLGLLYQLVILDLNKLDALFIDFYLINNIPINFRFIFIEEDKKKIEYKRNCLDNIVVQISKIYVSHLNMFRNIQISILNNNDNLESYDDFEIEEDIDQFIKEIEEYNEDSIDKDFEKFIEGFEKNNDKIHISSKKNRDVGINDVIKSKNNNSIEDSIDLNNLYDPFPFLIGVEYLESGEELEKESIWN